MSVWNCRGPTYSSGDGVRRAGPFATRVPGREQTVRPAAIRDRIGKAARVVDFPHRTRTLPAPPLPLVVHMVERVLTSVASRIAAGTMWNFASPLPWSLVSATASSTPGSSGRAPL
jgi:hypothetical protein